MARNNKLQTYAIKWLSGQSKTPEDIATELNLDISTVKSVLEKSTPQQDTSAIKTKKSGSRSKNLMITETSAKKNNHVAIMTKEASEYNDAVKRTIQTNNPNTQKAIFRPKDNE